MIKDSRSDLPGRINSRCYQEGRWDAWRMERGGYLVFVRSTEYGECRLRFSYGETTLNFEIFSVQDYRGVLSVIANLAAEYL